MTPSPDATEPRSPSPGGPASSPADSRAPRAVARDIALAAAAFLAPLLSVVLLQCGTQGCGLYLGWDSSTYAWWAVQVQTNGPVAMIQLWHYPHLYVMILTGLGGLLGNIPLAEHLLPLLASVPLGYAYYALTVRLTRDRRLGLLAAFLGGISVDTLLMVADLQRNLLALGISFPLGADIYLRLLSGAAERPRLRVKELALWLPLLFVVLATQLETYVVLALTLLLASLVPRKLGVLARALLVILVPVVVSLPVLLGYLLQYTAQTAYLQPLGVADAISQPWLYLSGFAIPFLALGIVLLARKARAGDPTARFLGFWLIALLVLLPAALALNVPAGRLLPLVPVPVLLALSLPTLRTWLVSAWRFLEDWGRRTARAGAAADGPATRRPSASDRTVRAGALVIAAGLVILPVVFTGVSNRDTFLVPNVTQGAIDTLTAAAGYVRQGGATSAILVLYGPLSAYYAPIYRAYFGAEIPNNYVYYGKLQFLFSLPEPGKVYNFQTAPSIESAYAVSYRNEVLARIGSAGIASQTIVIAGGETYPLPPSELFLSRFEVAPGAYVIPPNALGPREVDTWRLFARSDCFLCAEGAGVNESWAQAPQALGYLDTSGRGTFDDLYTFSLVHPWMAGNLTLRFWDWPAAVTSVSGSNATLAPLELYLDGRLVWTHAYAGRGVVDVAVPIGPITAGPHQIAVKSQSPGSGLGVAVLLDTLGFVPIS